MDTYLPPKYSLNSFFVRHVAHPRRMKYISGLGNAKICAVNDVGYINYANLGNTNAAGTNSPMQRLVEFPPNNFNDELLRSESLLFKRKEKAIPPNGIWNTFGLIDNTEKWRSQLNALASSVGLLTPTDLDEMRRKKERDEMIKSFQFKTPRLPAATPARAQSAAVTKLKSPSSTRLNEPLPSRNRTSRHSRAGATGSAHHRRTGVSMASAGGKHYVVDSADREIWMLQVLCQILQTDNLADVQSWLVSTSDQEKERVKQLIDQAMKGLEESGRITETNHNISTSNNHATADQLRTGQQQSVPNTEEHNRTQSSLAYIENALQKIDMNKPSNYKLSTKSKGNNNNNSKANILKLDDSTDNFNTNLSSVKLEPIPENGSSKLSKTSDFYDDEHQQQNLGEVVARAEGKEDDLMKKKEDLNTSSAIFNINMHAIHQDQKQQQQQQQHQQRKTPAKNALLENAVVKVETPKPSKEFKIEKVKVIMFLKDQESNSVQEIAGDWKSNN